MTTKDHKRPQGRWDALTNTWEAQDNSKNNDEEEDICLMAKDDGNLLDNYEEEVNDDFESSSEYSDNEGVTKSGKTIWVWSWLERVEEALL
ncbi:hypothetical protein LR48_Vigan04g141300 [Vigna angularis]|uniref:Uncharacterized protein n=1 Tax=Phaseolus angularis TaxID=3914 RepID=A0A0L9UE49_PHAAN|nr:hypothetical protein LR48_Vigan04g141300 [Vigna angularis]